MRLLPLHAMQLETGEAEVQIQLCRNPKSVFLNYCDASAKYIIHIFLFILLYCFI